MVDFQKARLNMVDSQLRTNKVSDVDLLEAFETVPRERFVPQHLSSIAYVDEDLAIGRDRYLIEPMILGRMLQEVRPMATDIVLDVGCCGGYSAAVLARLVATVVALESDSDLVAVANATLGEQGVDNAVVVEGPLAEGYSKQAPYNVILIAGAVAQVPEQITQQLAEGGRLVTVIKGADGIGRACLMLRSGDTVSKRMLFDANTPLLPEFERELRFVF